MKNYRLADPALKIPMPDMGGALFPADPAGLPLDNADPFVARLIREKSIVQVEAVKAPAKDKAKKDE